MLKAVKVRSWDLKDVKCQILLFLCVFMIIEITSLFWNNDINALHKDNFYNIIVNFNYIEICCWHFYCFWIFFKVSSVYVVLWSRFLLFNHIEYNQTEYQSNISSKCSKLHLVFNIYLIFDLNIVILNCKFLVSYFVK